MEDQSFLCHCGKLIPEINRSVHFLRCPGPPSSSGDDQVGATASEKTAEECEEDEDEIAMRVALPRSEATNGVFWECSTCTLHNSCDMLACAACGTSRAPRGASAPPLESERGNAREDFIGWSCPSCTFRNKRDCESCAMCGDKRCGEPSSIHEGAMEDDDGVRAPDASRRERLIGGGSDINDIFRPGALEGALDEQHQAANAQMNRVIGSAVVGGIFGAAQAIGSERSVMRGALQGASLAAVTTTMFNELENMSSGVRGGRAIEPRRQASVGPRMRFQARRTGGVGNRSFRVQIQGGTGAGDFVEMLRFFMQNAGEEDVDTMGYEELLTRFGTGGSTRPATERAISELTSEEFSSDQTDVEENDQAVCSICLSAFCKGNDVSTLPCGHAYHKDCIGQWLRNVNNCPICKQSI